MSRGTTITLMRAYKNRLVSKEDLAKLLEAEASHSSGFGQKTEGEAEKPKPLVVYDVRPGKDADYSRVLVETREEADVLLKWSFTSGFTPFVEAFGLSYYEAGRDTAIISESEAARIAQACRYLLSKNYSDEFEKILDNEWIERLASPDVGYVLSAWAFRKNPEALSDADSDDSAEWNIKRLLTCLETFLSYDSYEYGSDGNRPVLAVVAWG